MAEGQISHGQKQPIAEMNEGQGSKMADGVER